jgi:PAS domain S-box-containing protein
VVFVTNLPLEETGGALLDTEELLRESRLREREERLRLAEQAAAAGIWEIDVVADTVRGSPQFFRIMGLEPTDLPVPMTILRNLRPADDRERVNQGYIDTLAAGLDYYESEYRIMRGDGEERWILAVARSFATPMAGPCVTVASTSTSPNASGRSWRSGKTKPG